MLFVGLEAGRLPAAGRGPALVVHHAALTIARGAAVCLPAETETASTVTRAYQREAAGRAREMTPGRAGARWVDDCSSTIGVGVQCAVITDELVAGTTFESPTATGIVLHIYASISKCIPDVLIQASKPCIERRH